VSVISGAVVIFSGHAHFISLFGTIRMLKNKKFLCYLNDLYQNIYDFAVS
jgi:hypothetical protein